MKKDWLNHKLKGKLEGYASPLNSDQAWERLAAARQGKHRKKRRIFFFWLSGLSLCLALLIIGIYQSQYVSSPKELRNVQATIPFNNDKTTAQENKAQATSTEESPSMHLKESSRTQLSPNEVVDATIQQVEKRLVALNKIIPQNQTGVSSSSSSPSPSGISENVASGRIEDHPANPKIQQNPNQSSSPVQKTNVPDNNVEPVQQRHKSSLSSKNNYPLQKIKTLRHSAIPTERQLIIPINSIVERSSHKPTTTAKQWIIGLTGTYAKNWLRWTDIHQQQDYINRRQQSEKSLDSWQVQVQVQRQLGQHWFIQSGLTGRMAFSRFEDQYQTDSITVATIPVAQIIERQNGQRDSLSGTGNIRFSETGKLLVYNRHFQIAVPLYLGWQLPMTERTSLSVACGPVLTVYQSASGRTFADANSEGLYTSLKDLPYRKIDVQQVDIRLGLAYQLNRRWLLQAGLSGSWQWGNSLDAKLNYEERRHQIGGFLGLGITL